MNSLSITTPTLPKEVEALIPSHDSIRGAAYRIATESLYEVAQDMGDCVEFGSRDLFRDFEPEAAVDDDSDVIVRSVLSGRTGRTGRSLKSGNAIGSRRGNPPSTWRARLTSHHEESFIKTLSTRFSGLEFDFDIKEGDESVSSSVEAGKDEPWPDAPVDVEITFIGEEDEEEIVLTEEPEGQEEKGAGSEDEEVDIQEFAWPRPARTGSITVEDEEEAKRRRKGLMFRNSSFVEGWENHVMFTNLDQ